MSGPCFLEPANMCAQENLPAWLQLQHHIHAEREFRFTTHTHLHIPPPETHRDRSLIHIFLLGADFSSRGDGQSDSSISGGLRGDSSMLSHCLENRNRRQPLCSASVPYQETLAPYPRPFPPEAGVDQAGRCVWPRPKLQFLRLLFSRYPAELWAPASSSLRRRRRRRRYLHRRRALPQPPPRLPPPPPARAPSLRSPPCSSTRPPAGLPRSAATPPPRRGAQGSLGVHTLRSAQGRARAQAPGTSGCCECPCAQGAGGNSACRQRARAARRTSCGWWGGSPWVCSEFL